MHWFKTKDGRFLNLAMVTDTSKTFSPGGRMPAKEVRVYFAAANDAGVVDTLLSDPDDIARLALALDGMAKEHPWCLAEAS